MEMIGFKRTRSHIAACNCQQQGVCNYYNQWQDWNGQQEAINTWEYVMRVNKPLCYQGQGDGQPMRSLFD